MADEALITQIEHKAAEIRELQSVIPAGIGKINGDTDIRLAVTRNVRAYFWTIQISMTAPLSVRYGR